MVLHVIGLGLFDENDITLRGLNTIRKCDYVFLDSYTSVLGVAKEKLEKLYGKSITEADREDVELRADDILKKAQNSAVAFLVVGDPFSATTHSDLILRARQLDISVEVIHNASIVNAVSVTGLQIYRFGQIVSIPFFDGNWKPESFYFKIKANKEAGLHSLCLLDIKLKERTTENLMRGRSIYEKPRYMSVQDCISQLFEIEERVNEGVCGKETRAYGVARIGSSSQKIKSGTLEELQAEDFGGPLHSLVICASELHEVELEFYRLYYQ